MLLIGQTFVFPELPMGPFLDYDLRGADITCESYSRL